jgi:hypothetical protein
VAGKLVCGKILLQAAIGMELVSIETEEEQNAIIDAIS